MGDDGKEGGNDDGWTKQQGKEEMVCGETVTIREMVQGNQERNGRVKGGN